MLIAIFALIVGAIMGAKYYCAPITKTVVLTEGTIVACKDGFDTMVVSESVTVHEGDLFKAVNPFIHFVNGTTPAERSVWTEHYWHDYKFKVIGHF